MPRIEETPMKKKILRLLIALVVIVLAVFLLIRFVFISVDLTLPESLSFDLKNSESAVAFDEKIEKTFNYYLGEDSKITDDKKVEVKYLNDCYQAIVQRLNSNVTNINQTSTFGNYYLEYLSNVKTTKETDKELKKEVRALKKQLKAINSEHEEVLKYYDEQVASYITSPEESRNTERDNAYFSQLSTRLVAYLEAYQAYNSMIVEIILNHTNTTITQNSASKFFVKSENIYHNVSIKKCVDYYIDGKETDLSSLTNIAKSFTKQATVEADYYTKALDYDKDFELADASWVCDYFKVYSSSAEKIQDFKDGLTAEQKTQFDILTAYYGEV